MRMSRAQRAPPRTAATQHRHLSSLAGWLAGGILLIAEREFNDKDTLGARPCSFFDNAPTYSVSPELGLPSTNTGTRNEIGIANRAVAWKCVRFSLLVVVAASNHRAKSSAVSLPIGFFAL